jgi:hypothetical protein
LKVLYAASLVGSPLKAIIKRITGATKREEKISV